MEEFKQANQSTQAVFRIIETMAEHGHPIGVSDLARRLGMPRARVFRFLRTLLSIGYVSQDPQTEHYRLTLKLYHVGQAVADSTALVTEARPVLMRLRDDVGQSVSLSIIEREGVRILDLLRVETTIQVVLRPGALLPFHASAQGKIAMAYGDAEVWRHVRSAPLKPLTEHSCTDMVELQARVQAVRARGWADAPQEILLGLNGLAAPVFDATGRLAATIAVVGLINNVTSPPSDDLVARIRSAADSISTRLGGTGIPR